MYDSSVDASLDSRLRCDYVDLYYTIFGTRKPMCLIDADQQALAEVQGISSRRKSPIISREVVEEFKELVPVSLIHLKNTFK